MKLSVIEHYNVSRLLGSKSSYAAAVSEALEEATRRLTAELRRLDPNMARPGEAAEHLLRPLVGAIGDATMAALAPHPNVKREANRTTITLAQPFTLVATEVDQLVLIRPTGKRLKEIDGTADVSRDIAMVAACSEGRWKPADVERMIAYDILVAVEEAIILLGPPVPT